MRYCTVSVTNPSKLSSAPTCGPVACGWLTARQRQSVGLWRVGSSPHHGAWIVDSSSEEVLGSWAAIYAWPGVPLAWQSASYPGPACLLREVVKGRGNWENHRCVWHSRGCDALTGDGAMHAVGILDAAGMLDGRENSPQCGHQMRREQRDAAGTLDAAEAPSAPSHTGSPGATLTPASAPPAAPATAAAAPGVRRAASSAVLYVANDDTRGMPNPPPPPP
eukprot:359199-Chlamydomonas_euryale.AAC.1